MAYSHKMALLFDYSLSVPLRGYTHTYLFDGKNVQNSSSTPF